MATIGFINLSDLLLNQTVLDARASQIAKSSDAPGGNGLGATIQEEFTPSAQNAGQATLVPAGTATVATVVAPAANPISALVA